MGSLGEAVLDLTADASKLDPGLSEGKGKVTGALDGLKGTFSTATGTMLGQLSAGALRGLGQGIISVGKDITGAALDAEQAQAQLNAVLESTGGAAGMSADEINKLADSYSKLTMFDDEAIIGAESMLLTFTNVGEDVFPQATQTILDMSQALGQDLNASAMQLGKALNDPIQGVTALRRVGVQLTKDQENLVKSLMKVGDVAGAQKVILAELEKEFGGSAEAAGQTMAGQLAILNTEFENVKEEAGTAFLPVLKELVVVAKQLMPYLQQAIQWFSGLPGPVKTGVVALLGLVAVLAPLIGIISTVISVVSVLGPVFAAIGGALSAAALPILAIVAALALLYLAWKTNFLGIQQTVQVMGVMLKHLWNGILALFRGDTKTALAEFGAAWAAYWDEFARRFQVIGDWFSNIFGGIPETIGNAIKGMFSAIEKEFAQGIASIANIFKPVIEIFDDFKNGMTMLYEDGSGVLLDIAELFGLPAKAAQDFLAKLWLVIHGFKNGMTMLYEDGSGVLLDIAQLFGLPAKAAQDFLAKLWLVISGFKNGMTMLYEDGSGVLLDIAQLFGLPEKAAQEFLSSIWLVVDSFKNKITEMLTTARQIIFLIQNAFKIDWVVIGKGIIDGIINGLKNGIKAVIDAAKAVAKAALDAAKSALGIKSPSTEFAELGKFSGMGFTQGLRGSLTPQAVSGTLNRVMAGATQNVRSNHTNVTINNPIAEPATRSVDKTLKNLSYLGVIK